MTHDLPEPSDPPRPELAGGGATRSGETDLPAPHDPSATEFRDFASTPERTGGRQASQLDSRLLTPFASHEVSSCWSRIGILGGDGTCPELCQHIHCRNCPVYAAAGVQLLDRPLPAAYRDECTAHFSEAASTRLQTRTPAMAGATTARQHLLIFRVGGEWLALPTEVFQEVSQRRPIHVVPHLSNRAGGTVLGLVNIRGELLICVSIGRLLGLQDLPGSPFPAVRSHGAPMGHLLILSYEGSRFAFPVDEIHGTQRVDPADVQAVPATVARARTTYTRGTLPSCVVARKANTAPGGDAAASAPAFPVGCLDVALVVSALNRQLT